jgi:hypothetical protein
MHWGEITPKGCVAGTGTREWSAILWDIPEGESWKTICEAAPARVNGNPARRPNRCDVGLNVWGVWQIPDESCGPPPPTTYELVVFPPRRLRPVRIEAVFERNRNGTFEVIARSAVADVPAGSPAAYRWRTELPYPSALGRVTIRVWVRRPDGTETSAGEATRELGSGYEAADRALMLEFRIRELNDGRYEVKPNQRIDP